MKEEVVKVFFTVVSIYKTDNGNICPKKDPYFLVYLDLKETIYKVQTSGVFNMRSAGQSQVRTAGIMLIMLVFSLCCQRLEKQAGWILLC